MAGGESKKHGEAAGGPGAAAESPVFGAPANPRSMISQHAIEDFLVAIHFGKTDLLASCVRLAYRDLQRTVRGVAQYDKAGIPERVRGLIADARRAHTQDEFDQWHCAACGQLIDAFRGIGYQHFTIGHAQKWLNMTLKYIFVLGDRVPGYEHLFGYCHVPLDQFVMRMAVPLGLPALPGTGAWSTLNDYAVYMERQGWFRARPEPPLVAEFGLWLDYVSGEAQNLAAPSGQD